jgi:hypothetical protein
MERYALTEMYGMVNNYNVAAKCLAWGALIFAPRPMALSFEGATSSTLDPRRPAPSHAGAALSTKRAGLN